MLNTKNNGWNIIFFYKWKAFEDLCAKRSPLAKLCFMLSFQSYETRSKTPYEYIFSVQTAAFNWTFQTKRKKINKYITITNIYKLW